jgi:hypothetical protein
MAKITIRRTKEGGVLGILTEVDGEKIGRLRPKKEISHEVAAGRHELKLKRGMARVTAEFDLAEDEEVRFVCSEASGFGSTGKIDEVAVGRALFTKKGGLTLEFDETPPTV